jgi:phosphatidylglycerophosphatase A
MTFLVSDFINRIINTAFVETETTKTLLKRSFLDYAALWIATCGVGYMPLVPATWGSLAGVGLYLLAQTVNVNFTHFVPVIFLIGLFLIGIWSAARVVKLTGRKDPRIVIIDEIVGQLVTFLFVPAQFNWWIIIIGFFAFRLFDILKPFPANRLENLPNGLGVMADDVMAGFYAGGLLYLLYSFVLVR